MRKKKNTLSDFLRQIYNFQEVKDVKEAFISYPAEEEWHQGKIENVIAEDSEEYSVYEIGDIVFVSNYEYENKTKGSNHLFVIIDKNNMAVPIQNIGMLISSKVEKAKYEANQLLTQSKKNGLKKDSIVKTDVVYKILNSQILFQVGSIDQDTVKLYKDSYNLLRAPLR